MKGSKVEGHSVALARDPATPGEQLLALRTVYEPELDRLLARHPNAPSDLLETLSHSADKATRRQVVRHASTPKEVLLRLAPQSPRDFLCNPVIDWMLIEEPDLLQNLGKGVLRNVLKSATCPDALMGWAARNGTVEHQLALAMNPAATPEILETLAALKGEVGVAARAHVRYPKPSRLAKGTSGQFIKEVKSGLASLEPYDAASLWRRGLIGPAQWLYLSAGSRAAVIGLPESLEGGSWPRSSRCIALAKSKLCPPELLEFLAKHPDRVADNWWEQRSAKRVTMAVARNPNAPRSLLEALASHQEREVRAAVGSNKRAPGSLLVALASDREDSVREAVAGNEATSKATLETLLSGEKAGERSWGATSVKVALAKSPATTDAILESLARDPEYRVREAVAGNEATPEAVLEVLASDHRAGDEEPWESRQIRLALAKNPATPAAVLEALATDLNYEVREAVASNKATPGAVLELLGRDAKTKSWGAQQVRVAVARNPSAPSTLLEDLATDSEYLVREAVATNEATPLSVLGEAFTKNYAKDLRLADLLRGGRDRAVIALALASDKLPREAHPRSNSFTASLRRKALSPSTQTGEASGSTHRTYSDLSGHTPRWIQVASDPATKPEVLAELSSRRSLVLRWLVASNPNTPEPIVKELTVILWLALGYEALPPRARDFAEESRPQVRLILDARHWWHKLHLQARRYGYIGLPRSIPDSELVGRFQRELKCFARNPRASLAAEVIGANGQSLFRLKERRDTWGRSPVSLALSLKFREREESFARQPAGLPRLFALLHANAPVEALVKAYRSVDWMERMAVARNPNAPAKMLAALKKDANRFVAKQAADTEALQQELQQWPALAIKLHDRWQLALTGLTSGTAVWDGFEGETAELLGRLRAHRKALEPILATAQDSNASTKSMALHADQSIALKRVVKEIITRARAHHMSEWMWNDPEWAQRVCAEDILAWLKHRAPDPSAVIATLQAQVSGLDQNKVFSEMAAEVVSLELRVPVRNPLPSTPPIVAPAVLEVDLNTYLEPPSSEGQWHLGQRVVHWKFGAGIIIGLQGMGSEARAEVHFQVAGYKWLQLSLARLEPAPGPRISNPEMLAHMGASGRTTVRRAVAAHLETPLDTLLALAADPHADVRRQVVSRPDVAEEVLQLLALDTDRSVLVQLASREALPGSVAQKLMHHSDPQVLLAVAAMRAITPTVCEHLATVSNPAVRLALARNPDTSSDLARKLLVVLSTDVSADVRVSVAEHPRTGEDLLHALENDDEEDVRSAVYARRFAEDWSAPFDDKPSFKKLAAVVRRLFVTHESADAVETDPDPISIAQHVLVGLQGLNLIPKAPSGRCLAQAARSKDWLTRLAVALHPQATSPQLKLLEKDEIPAVAHAVRSRTTGTWAH